MPTNTSIANTKIEPVPDKAPERYTQTTFTSVEFDIAIRTDFVDCEFVDCEFTAAWYCNFVRCTFRETKFYNGEGEYNFKLSKFSVCDFIECKFFDAHMKYCEFEYQCHLSNCHFEDFSFHNGFFYSVSLEDCSFSNTYFENSEVLDSRFLRCSLGTAIRKTAVHFTEFHECNLSDLECIYPSFDGVHFNGCRLNWNNPYLIGYILAQIAYGAKPRIMSRVAWATFVSGVQVQAELCWTDIVESAPWDMTIWAVGEMIKLIHPLDDVSSLPIILLKDIDIDNDYFDTNIVVALIETYPDYYGSR